MTVNRVCGSGAQAVITVAQQIAAGDVDTGVAGGMENMDRAPHLDGGRWDDRVGPAEIHDGMLRDGLDAAFSGKHSGWHTEELVTLASERGIAVRQGIRLLRSELPGVLTQRSDVLSPRMVHLIEDLIGDWRRLDDRIEGLSSNTANVVAQDAACERLMTVPGIGSIISSAKVAAIGTGDVFSKGRDFAAWLGLVPRQISTRD